MRFLAIGLTCGRSPEGRPLGLDRSLGRGLARSRALISRVVGSNWDRNSGPARALW